MKLDQDVLKGSVLVVTNSLVNKGRDCQIVPAIDAEVSDKSVVGTDVCYVLELRAAQCHARSINRPDCRIETTGQTAHMQAIWDHYVAVHGGILLRSAYTHAVASASSAILQHANMCFMTRGCRPTVEHVVCVCEANAASHLMLTAVFASL